MALFRAFRKQFTLVSLLYLGVFTAQGQEKLTRTDQVNSAQQPSGSLLEMSLDDCLTSAMKNNRNRSVSKLSVLMAEAQHRQALSAYWPQVTGKLGYQRVDESPDFLFPASTMAVPAQTLTIPNGGTIPITIPGFGVVNMNSISVPAQQISIPAQDVKLMDPDTFTACMNLSWLLWDGGMRKGYREQTQGLIDMAKEEARRTDLEITDSVKRMYYGAILARTLHQVGKDTLARMEATLNLTETMYKQGAGRVKKTDYLETKVTVESLRAMVSLLEKNESAAQAALGNTIGFTWSTSIKPVDAEIPYQPYAENLDTLVSSAYKFSPDWAKIEDALSAAGGATRTAKSGHYPKVGVSGELHKLWNDYDAGIMTDRNKEGWSVGVGVEIPIFSGFYTMGKVAEARARVEKLKEQQFLLKDGIGLQIKNAFLTLNAAQKSFSATTEALKAAEENRDLNTRAYQNELVDTEKVIRAQLMEAFMAAQHYKTRYDHITLQSQINFLVGSEVLKKLNNQP